MADTLPPLPEPDVTAYITDSAMRSLQVRAHSDRQLEAYARAALAAVPAQPVAWMWDQANWPEHDVRGRGWYPAIGREHPGMPWMTKNVQPLYAAPQAVPVVNQKLTTEAQAVPVPAGWVLVPVEPTEAMEIAGAIAHDESKCHDKIGPIQDAYRAMLAAAPKEQP